MTKGGPHVQHAGSLVSQLTGSQLELEYSCLHWSTVIEAEPTGSKRSVAQPSNSNCHHCVDG